MPAPRAPAGRPRPHGADLSLASRIHESNNAFAIGKRTERRSGDARPVDTSAEHEIRKGDG